MKFLLTRSTKSLLFRPNL